MLMCPAVLFAVPDTIETNIILGLFSWVLFFVFPDTSTSCYAVGFQRGLRLHCTYSIHLTQNGKLQLLEIWRLLCAARLEQMELRVSRALGAVCQYWGLNPQPSGQSLAVEPPLPQG